MKAWQFTNTPEPLVLNEVDEPIAGPGEVVLEIKAAGLCHSDVGVLTDEGWLDMLVKRPTTLGHENAGVIAKVGEGVTGYQVGDRVGVCPTTPRARPATATTAGSHRRWPSMPRHWCRCPVRSISSTAPRPPTQE